MKPLWVKAIRPRAKGWTFASSKPMPGVAERTAPISERTISRSLIQPRFASAQIGAAVR